MEKKKIFQWIDDSVTIDFEVPAWVQEKMELLEKYDLEDNYMYFPVNDDLDVDLKNWVAKGKMTQAQWNKIMMRYRM